jgi:hypothetical protein
VLSTLAQDWLTYARSVFACGTHLNACNAPLIDGIDPELRWPGFVGVNYEAAPKRLLLVGRVHNPSGWHGTSGLGGLELIARRWLAAELSDEEFYSDYSREYGKRLVTWGPWQKVYRHLAAAAGADEQSVAYVNVAKCWQNLGKESALQRRCSETWPLESLVEIVKPHGVFVLAPESWMQKVKGAQVTSVPFRYDSAPHFQIPTARLREAHSWVTSL